LWDLAHEVEITRTVVEEAKITLMLRLMVEFKQWQKNESKRDEDIQNYMTNNKICSKQQVIQKLFLFEERLGQIMDGC